MKGQSSTSANPAAQLTLGDTANIVTDLIESPP